LLWWRCTWGQQAFSDLANRVVVTAWYHAFMSVCHACISCSATGPS
jgi:hypothetical protein